MQQKLPTICDNNNSTVDDRLRRFDLGCSHCPPNKHENATRKGTHGVKKPKYKNKRTK